MAAGLRASPSVPTPVSRALLLSFLNSSQSALLEALTLPRLGGVQAIRRTLLAIPPSLSPPESAIVRFVLLDLLRALTRGQRRGSLDVRIVARIVSEPADGTRIARAIARFLDRLPHQRSREPATPAMNGNSAAVEVRRSGGRYHAGQRLRHHRKADRSDLARMVARHLQAIVRDDGNGGGAPGAWRDAKVDRTVHTALRLVAERWRDTGLRLDDVAKHVDRSRCHIDRLIVRETGSGLRDHIATLRVAHAIARLTADSSQVKRTALEGGYCSASQMDRDFRRCVGITPHEFRDAVADLKEALGLLMRIADGVDLEMGGEPRVRRAVVQNLPHGRSPCLTRAARVRRK